MVSLAKSFAHSAIWGYARGYLALVTVLGGFARDGAMREMGLCASQMFFWLLFVDVVHVTLFSMVNSTGLSANCFYLCSN